MKPFHLLESIFLVILMANFSPNSLTNTPREIITSHSYMTSENIKIKSVTLLARQQTRPPLGVPSTHSRDVGFASVFLRIENSSEADAKLVIQKIEICNANDGRIQKFSQPPQEITLHPLEDSENVFHLTNKTGYVGQDKVKAVITYKLGSQVYVIESDSVDVKRI